MLNQFFLYPSQNLQKRYKGFHNIEVLNILVIYNFEVLEDFLEENFDLFLHFCSEYKGTDLQKYGQHVINGRWSVAEVLSQPGVVLVSLLLNFNIF